MKTTYLFSAALFAAASLLAADSTPKEEITKAANKLSEQPNYAWHTTVVVPDDAPFKPGPTDGKIEKDGYTWLKMSMRDNKMEAVVKVDKGVIKQDDAWRTLQDYDKEEGFGRMPANIVRRLKVPAKEAVDLAAAAKDLKQDGDVISGDLTEEGAKALQRFGPPGGGGPAISDASGSVKFWLKDGALTKYEYKVKGKINFNGNEFPNERTTTVEIKDIGQTKVEVPEEARKKISG